MKPLLPLQPVQLAGYEVRVKDGDGISFTYGLCLLAHEPPERVFAVFAELVVHTSFQLVVPDDYQVLSIANLRSRTVYYGPFLKGS